MSDDLDKALAKQKRARTMFSVAKVLFVTYLTLILTVIAIQGVILNIASQDALVQIHNAQVDNQVVTTANHQLTRKYIRCLLEIIQLSPDQRTVATFDDCNTDSVNSANTDPNTKVKQ